ncbi:site-specific integrase [Desmonostoc muscorum LEGE 12446]|uniref:Site-specific integrase n=1 Tax=Desmonostoc muscorum LEGE 12446 TaxID=1828758 RepID=A0A8J6ZIB6_DESMC|nr:site-specific integrase [Desmonostoc muscorum]MCF2152207.1 site-specific integrase [Desmonostoc muscorum LEGE 12446]
MKIDRHGKAKVLSPEEIQRLFTSGLTTVRDRTLIAVMLYTGCRVNEAVTLNIKDVYNSKGRIRAELIIRKGNSKGKLATRSIPILEELRCFLATYKPTNSRDGFLFPGRWGRSHLHSEYASLIFREACERVDIEGASTHSCRRTALTLMSNAGIPLRVIQEISGHRSLEQLQHYLEVEPSQVRGAIAALSMLSPPSVSSSNFDNESAKNTNFVSE